MNLRVGVAVGRNHSKVFHFMEYTEILTHGDWQKRRLQIMERDGFQCTKCTEKFNLQIHHLYYRWGWLPWEYPDDALVTLCDLCHKKEEFIKWVIRHGLKALQGFDEKNLDDIRISIIEKMSANHHRESVLRYIDDIKRLMLHG